MTSNEPKKPTVFTEIATKCDFCDFSTKDPKAMERHIKIRQRDSETQCEKCPMKFCTVGSMMFHATEKHTRQQKILSEFKCEKCHFISGKVDELYKHQQNAKIFSKGPHLCTDCTFQFCTKFDLNTHLAKVHGKDVTAQAPVQKVSFDYSGQWNFDYFVATQFYVKSTLVDLLFQPIAEALNFEFG